MSPRDRTWKSPWKRATVIAGLIVIWVLVVRADHLAVVGSVQAPRSGGRAAAGAELAPPLRHRRAQPRRVHRAPSTARDRRSPSSVAVIVCAVAIGTVLGSLAGFFGGWIESVIMRLVDITLAFPPIFLAMAVAAALGPGLRNAFFAMVIVWWPIYARLLRGQVQAVKHRDHIQAAVSIGATKWRILRKHVLPLSFTPALINATLDLGQVVILTATLSFLGLGAKPPSPEWGAMITEGAQFFYQWWIAVAPGIAILTVGMAFNFLGDGLREALDVRAKR